MTVGQKLFSRTGQCLSGVHVTFRPVYITPARNGAGCNETVWQMHNVRGGLKNQAPRRAKPNWQALSLSETPRGLYGTLIISLSCCRPAGGPSDMQIIHNPLGTSRALVFSKSFRAVSCNCRKLVPGGEVDGFRDSASRTDFSNCLPEKKFLLVE